MILFAIASILGAGRSVTKLGHLVAEILLENRELSCTQKVLRVQNILQMLNAPGQLQSLLECL